MQNLRCCFDRLNPSFIEGIGKVNGKLVILLNVNNVLSMQEIGEMGQAAASATVTDTVLA